jgi:hypothetical protein
MKKFLLTVICVAGMVACSRVSADTITYALNVGSSAIAGYAGPYGTVTVDLTSPTTATITFASLTAGGNVYLFGDGRSVDVNVNAPSFSVGTVSGSNAGTGFTPGPYFLQSYRPALDVFGAFNVEISSYDGYLHCSDLVTFGLTDLSGTWAGAASVLTENNAGYLVAGDIWVNQGPDANGDNWIIYKPHGYAAGDGQTVPDGGMTAALLGLGMLGLGFFARRKA